MTATMLVAALCVGIALGAASTVWIRPAPRLAGRVRPYTIVTRAILGRSADVLAAGEPTRLPRNALWKIFGPPAIALSRRLGRAVSTQSDAALELQLRQAGLDTVTADEWRIRRVLATGGLAALGLFIGVMLVGTPALAIVLACCGATVGATRSRSRLVRAIRERAERMRIELYTVNQLLALQIRTGAGPVQATQRLVDRTRGVVVEELDAVLAWIRNGASESDAFRRAAEVTPEPAAARTYRLIATGTERGSDLGVALLALSEDLRDARREELRRSATRRRAAMLLPTIAILAPIMLLFIAAPLPSIVLGSR